MTDPIHAKAKKALILSLVLIMQGVRLFRQKGNIDLKRENGSLVGIEKTTELVTSGVYRYIRHPFYGSLLFLAWGIFFNHITWIGGLLAISVTVFLFITARKEEVENINFFGKKFHDYMQTTRMFIPFVW